MNKSSVVVITVTYNRSDKLKRTLESIVEQENVDICKIIVVDNNNSEEHKKNILKFGCISHKIEVLELDQNYGGAGGFYYGMKYAKEKYNPDWYWIMDDDAYPTKSCLNILMKETNKWDDIGFVAPLTYGITKKSYQKYHHKYISKYLDSEKHIGNIDELKPVTEIEANAFVGPLISKKAIDTIGLPDKDLFIYGDDTEYTFRITRVLRGLLVKDAIIQHEDISSDINDFSPNSWWKEYYQYRNKYLFINKFSTNKFAQYIGFIKFSLVILKKIVKTMIDKRYKNKLIRIRVLKKSFKDGFFNNTGKLLDPSEYIEYIKKTPNKFENNLK